MGRIVLSEVAIHLGASTTLELSQITSNRVDYLTPFDLVIPMLGLHEDSQGKDALIHAMLQLAGYSTRIRYANGNPCDEVIHALEEAGANQNALAFLRAFFNTASTAYSRRE